MQKIKKVDIDKYSSDTLNTMLSTSTATIIEETFKGLVLIGEKIASAIRKRIALKNKVEALQNTVEVLVKANKALDAELDELKSQIESLKSGS